MARKKWTSVSLPPALLKQVDDFVARNTQGYVSKPQVINAAIRRFLDEEMPELKRPPVERRPKKAARKTKP